MSANPMLPFLGRLEQVQDLAREVKLLRIAPQNGGEKTFRGYRPGQFIFLSAFGTGEAPFGLAGTPERGPLLEVAVARVGAVTSSLHELGPGDTVGLRGPYGNGFPMDALRGKNLLVVGGGIGGAPLRPVIQHVLAHRRDYGRLTILWAARSPALLVFTGEYDEWRQAPGTALHLTVDTPEDGWPHRVGLVTELLEAVAPSPENAAAITCGPPAMIFHTTRLLDQMGFPPRSSFVTLEARMHCGLGKCGRCNLGEKLVCTDGPVFDMLQVGDLLESYL